MATACLRQCVVPKGVEANAAYALCIYLCYTRISSKSYLIKYYFYKISKYSYLLLKFAIVFSTFKLIRSSFYFVLKMKNYAE